MYTSTGQLRIFKDGSVKLICDEGILEYYKHLIEKRWYGAKVQRGKYGSHITVVYVKEGVSKETLKKIKKYDKKKIEFTYDPYVHIGGLNRDFKNFWIKCDFPEFWEIRKELGLQTKNVGYGPHITICNTKNI
jgi:hypothetical protein